MFMKSSLPLFMLLTILGTMITISSNNWFMAWLGMELNMMGFIPMMINYNNKLSQESMMKYFLIQSIASSILIMSATMMPIMEWTSINTLTMMALIIKLGAAPFHQWVPTIMEGLKWETSLILLTWQKIAPLNMIPFSTNNYLMMLVIFLSATMGSLGAIPQTSIKKTMAYSSISHLSWILMTIQMNFSLTMMYFTLYTLSMYPILLILKNSFSTIQQMSMLPKHMKILMLLNLISLSGMPPLMMFFPKWLLLNLCMEQNLMIPLMWLMLSSLINLFFYLRIMYSTFMLQPNYQKMSTMNFMQWMIPLFIPCSSVIILPLLTNL